MAFASKTAFSCAGPRTSRNVLPTRLSRHRRVECVAKAGTRKQLPIFPLNVVALPSATVPLMIFEARYRVLFNTILAGEAGVEQDLVQTESPFCGSRRFGMCYVDGRPDPSGASRMASVGTVLEVVDFAHVQDGRIFITTKGRERFRVLSIVKERPIMIAEVEELEEDEAEGEEVVVLAKEVADLLRSTIRLNVKLNNLEASEDQLEPEELAGLGPRDLSYWIASFFGDIKVLQQSLLEEESTVKRLNREKEILSDTVRYYSATVALKSLSMSSPSSGSSAGDDKAKEA
ncbi:hypothetical protein PLESTB_001007100 [Pleodorina starrii]|uniref:Lon N-terminal domain-containing protein n=1 Tax=Pleodorina starrii TaxID=330485 RepID=A0A9W6BNP9_9CHLO|nr:hypothetical protein PLESTM_001200600 [Pleodorina starrii]GLC55616.1 hypothetical protein PLESTB_001007100 [Pleodorina starrii]GLC65366.1 hypothetical protein PLESTF_000285400 [Pleodorina starrii]